MAGKTVLIAGYSGRALAQSARRAGYVPLVADLYGDADTTDAAAHCRRVEAWSGQGFSAKGLVGALDELAAAAHEPPVGLVLGSGLEGTPRLLDRLGERYRLIGNSADVIQRTKDPEVFFGALDRLGVAHPETSRTPPSDRRGWLRKRVGGSGGTHIVDCAADERPDKRSYFQCKVAGDEISMLGILGPASTAFAFSRQWTAPTRALPYRYGGAVGSIPLDADTEGRMIDAALAVTQEFRLVGLVSFDFIVTGGAPLLIEVNARPGATLDIFDDDKGTLFDAHLAGSAPDGDPAEVLATQWTPPIARASAYLYADRGRVTQPAIDWPDWTRDRSPPGTVVAKFQPIATVVADGGTADEAEALCRERLRLLEDMMYEGRAGKEPH